MPAVGLTRVGAWSRGAHGERATGEEKNMNHLFVGRAWICFGRAWIGDRLSSRPSCYKNSTFLLTDGQPPFMICSRATSAAPRRPRRTLARQLRRSAKARLNVNRAAAGENQDGRGQAARAGYAVARVGERGTHSRA